MVPWTLARSRLARAIQIGESPEVVEQLRSEYRTARLGHVIRATAPELTAEQRAELAGVLAGGDGNAAA